METKEIWGTHLRISLLDIKTALFITWKNKAYFFEVWIFLKCVCSGGMSLPSKFQISTSQSWEMGKHGSPTRRHTQFLWHCLCQRYLCSKCSFHADLAKRSISGELKGKVPNSISTCWLLTNQPALQRKERTLQSSYHLHRHKQKPLHYQDTLRPVKPSLEILK